MSRKGSPNGRRTDNKGRSKGEAQFVPIPHQMAKSPAFRSLGGAALKIWIELRSRYNGSNNGMLSLSLRDAAALLGMSQTTAKRGFDELIEKGFVVRRLRGQWYGRKAAEYIVTDRSYQGRPPTRDWQSWRRKNKTSVPKQTSNEASVPDQYRGANKLCHHDSRRVNLKVINGAA